LCVYDMTRLRSDEALNHFNTALDEKVGSVDVESPVIETARNYLQEAINIACKESIGHAHCVNRNWFDKNGVTLTRLIDEKRAALNGFRADPNSNRKKIAYRKAKAEVQAHSRRGKNMCMQDRAREIQEYADTNSAFSALTLLVGHQEGHLACKKTEWWDVGVVVCMGCRLAYSPADAAATHYLLLQ